MVMQGWAQTEPHLTVEVDCANTISGNGTNPAAALGRFGIGMFNSTADIIGLNTVSGNASHGIFARSSSLLVGDLAVGLSSDLAVRRLPACGTQYGVCHWPYVAYSGQPWQCQASNGGWIPGIIIRGSGGR